MKRHVDLLEKEIRYSEEELLIAKKIGPIIRKETERIFESHAVELLSNPETYIIPAIWGCGKNDELTPTQQQINQAVASIIKQIFDILQFYELNSAQQFQADCMIRNLLAELLRNKVEYSQFEGSASNSSVVVVKDTDNLMNLKPVGRA